MFLKEQSSKILMIIFFHHFSLNLFGPRPIFDNCHIRQCFHSTLFTISVFSYSMFCPSRCFFPFDVISGQCFFLLLLGNALTNCHAGRFTVYVLPFLYCTVFVWSTGTPDQLTLSPPRHRSSRPPSKMSTSQTTKPTGGQRLTYVEGLELEHTYTALRGDRHLRAR